MTHVVSAIVNQLVSDDLLTDMKSLTITGLDLQKFDGGIEDAVKGSIS